MRGKSVVFFFFILIFCELSALSKDRWLNQYVKRNWESLDGLPQNYVTSIVQDRKGYIWIGTELGFAKFDGLSFTIS